MSVRAKFRVSNIFNVPGSEGTRVVLHPVYGESPENKEFFSYTPSGEIQMYIKNKVAEEQFVVGYEFYIDFTKA